jgi:hypothetical protein
MARYFFHLHNDADTLDEDGSEFPDDAAAIAHGRTEALAMASASVSEHSHLVLDHHVIVANDEGQCLARIRFGDVVEIRG